jgi:mannose-6-phosphate isomerase-like protein (cupin superfamily)
MSDNGYAIGNFEEMGEGPGFRKVRRELGVTSMGANVLVVPPGVKLGWHDHERQEEIYFVHRGTMSLEIEGEGVEHRLAEGGVARVDAATKRRIGNAEADRDLAVFIVGAQDGYVGRDAAWYGNEDVPGEAQRAG